MTYEGGVRVSVVVPTRNRADRCNRLLHALARQTLDPGAFEVIVVDDCSEDSTSELLRTLKGELPYTLRPLRTQVNRGAGPARNLGWTTAGAPVIAFTDDDCVPGEEWLEAGVAHLEAHPAVGVLQGRTLASNLDALYTTRLAHAVIVDGPTPYFESCNIFYRRPAIEPSGGFGEDYNRWSSPAWGEDTLAGWSALEAGWQRAFAPDAVVTHDVELRDLRWWIKTGLSQYREVAIGRRHPQYRQEAFWRPWAPRRDDAAFALAAAGTLAALRWRPAIAATLPYLWWRRPSIRRRQFLHNCVRTVVIDSARTAGNIYGAIKSHTFVV